MILVALLVIFFLAELLYFRLADHYNIVDKPNERSSHSIVTIRGGGIIFFLSAISFSIYSHFQYQYFIIGLTSIAIVSFLDDIFTLPNRYRLPFQFFAVIMIIVELNLSANEFSWLILGLLLVVGVGIINAYNFMDGINGMTGGYSLLVLVALWIVNSFYKTFIEEVFLQFIILSVLVFNFFNFRVKAKCFAGDVGSISMAVIIVFLIGKISFVDKNPIYFLFLTVYGVDTVLTIIHRLILKENIFKAHNKHLFQVIVQKTSISHLQMSFIYAFIQFFICMIVLSVIKSSVFIQLLVILIIVTTLSTTYIFFKLKLQKIAIGNSDIDN